MISPVGEYLIQLGSVPFDDGGTAAEVVSLKTEEETGAASGTQKLRSI